PRQVPRSPTLNSAANGIRSIASASGRGLASCAIRPVMVIMSWLGTKTLSQMTVLLPVPRIPATCQVSLIDTSDIGMNAQPWLIIWSFSSRIRTPPMNQSECRLPLANPQLPDTRYPSPEALADPVNPLTPQTMGSSFD